MALAFGVLLWMLDGVGRNYYHGGLFLLFAFLSLVAFLPPVCFHIKLKNEFKAALASLGMMAGMIALCGVTLFATVHDIKHLSKEKWLSYPK